MNAVVLKPTFTARRTKEGEFEPEDDDEGELESRDMNTPYESEIDLSEESASDSDAECDTGEIGETKAKRRPRPDRYNSAVK